MVEEIVILPSVKRVKIAAFDDDQVHTALYQNHLPMSILQNSHDFATQPYFPITTYISRRNLIINKSRRQRSVRSIRAKLRSKQQQQQIMKKQKRYNQPKNQNNIITKHLKSNTRNEIHKKQNTNIIKINTNMMLKKQKNRHLKLFKKLKSFKIKPHVIYVYSIYI